MHWLFILLPGFLAASYTEKLEKQKKQKKQSVSIFNYIKSVCIYDLFINFCSVTVYYYVIRNEGTIMENLQFNSFLIRFGALNILLALFLPVIYCAIKPWFSIRIEKKESGERRNTDDEK